MPVTWEDFEAVDQPKTEVDWAAFEAAPEDPRKAALESQMQSLRRQRVGGNILESAASLAGQAIEPLTPSGWLNQPARIAGYQDPFAPGRPIVPIPKPTGTGVMAGLGRLGANIAESLETPEGVVTLPALPASRVIQSLTAAQMAADTPRAVLDAVEVFKDPNSTVADKVAAAGNPVVQATAAGLLARGPVARVEPVRAPMAEALAKQIQRAPLEVPEQFRQPTPITPEVAPWAQLTKPPPSVKRAAAPEVPATPPEPERGITVLEEIRSKNARTKEQIKALYPQLNREEAGELRDRAWGKPPEPPAEPPAAPVPKEPTPPTKGPATTEEVLGKQPISPAPTPTEGGAATSPAAPALAPEEAPSPMSSWMKSNIEETMRTIPRTTLDRIEDLAAQGKTAEQITQETGLDKQVVIEARIGLKIPSRTLGALGTGDINPEFVKWAKEIESKRKAPPAAPTGEAQPTVPAAGKAEGGVSAPPAPAIPEGGISPAKVQEGVAEQKVESEVQKVARTEGQRPAKEVKNELVVRLEKAIEDAKSESPEIVKLRQEMKKSRASGNYKKEQSLADDLANSLEKSGVGKTTIDIPGDGVFTVWNTKEALGSVLERANRISTKSTEPVKVKYTGISKEDRAWVEAQKAAQTTPPSTGEGMVGPGSPAATQPPDPTTFGVKTGNPILNHIEAKAKKVYRGIGQLFQRRDVRTALPQSANGVETLANTYGDQARRGLELNIPDKVDREATSMLMQSLKQPDPQPWLRTRAQDMETAAQAFVQRGTAEDRIQAKSALDMAKGYRHAAENFERLRPKAEEAKRRFDSVYTRDTNSGINVEYEQWYVPQRWDLDLIKSGDGPIVLGGSSKGTGGQSFRKAKVFNDFGEAIEYALSTPGEYFVPRTLDIAELLGHRARTSERLIQRKRFFEELKDVSDPVNGKPIATDIPRRRIDRPDGTVDYQESVPRDYERFEILPGNPIAIHKGYSRLIKALMGHSDLTESATVRTIQDIAAVEKHLALVLDTFHASRMLQGGAALGHKLYVGKTLKQALSLVEYSPQDLALAVRNGDITQGMADYVNQPVEWQINGRPVMDTRHNIVKMLGKNGLNYGRVADAVYRDWIRNLPGIGTVNKWVFDKVSRGVTADIGQMEFDRISRARPDLDATQVSRMVARDVNAFFGNLQKESIFKGRTTNAIMQVGFLAHQWVESLAKRELLAARQFAQIPVDIAKGRPVSIGTAARGVGTGVAAYIVGTQLLNLFTRGHLTFSNPEEGHKLDAWIPDITGKIGGFFISPLSVFGEITHDVLRYSRTKPTLHEAVLQVAHNKLGPLGRAAYVAGTGRDPVSDARLPSTAARALTAAWQVTPRPIIAGTAGQLVASKVAPGKVSAPPPGAMQRQLTASMGFKTEPAGTAAGQLHNLAREWMDKNTDPKVKERLVQLQAHDTPSIFQDLRSALRNGDTALAKAEFSRLVRTHDVKDIARSIQRQHPFTGSIATDRRFLASLNDYQKGLYRQAIKDRSELAKKFVDMARDYYKERNKNASSK